jgi:hypothetical protein
MHGLNSALYVFLQDLDVCLNLQLLSKWEINIRLDRLCGPVVRVLGYRSGGPGSIPGTTSKKK